MKRTTIVLIVAVLLLSFSVGGFGVNTVDKIEAYLANDMKFKVDNELWQPKDVDGTLLYPIIFNGRSYVPVRALLESKGVKVGFNDAERTIILDYGWDVSKVKEPGTDKNEGWDVSKVEQNPGVIVRGWDVSKVKQADTDGIGGWDLSKLKRDDLNSIISMDVWEVEDNPDIRIIDFNSNKLFDLKGISFANESKFTLSKDVKILIEGKVISVEELAKGLSKDIEIVEYRNGDSSNKLSNSDKTDILDAKEVAGISILSLSKITLEYNKEMGQVTGINIRSMDADGDGRLGLLDIYISTENNQRRAVSIIQRDRQKGE